MKKLFLLFFLLTTSLRKSFTRFAFLVIGFVLFSINANAQVTKTVGISGSDYATLKLAFDAINAGTLTGAIQLQIKDNTTETASSLNASGVGSANYTSVLIYPTVTGKTITAQIFGTLIALNGANNVTFDGRLRNSSGVLTGSAADLIISNTAADPAATTIRLTANASNNTITYCTIKGKGNSNTLGTVTLNAPTVASAIGCGNNTISNNTFTGTATGTNNRPWTVIYSAGISGAENTGNTIQNNDFVNCTQLASTGICVNFGTFNKTTTISGNSFFENEGLASITGTQPYTFISVTGGSGYTVSNNYIGGTATQCGGTNFIKTSGNNQGNVFKGIAFSSAITSGSASVIQNNTIKKITWASVGTGNAAWTGIELSGAHDVSVIGNTIGDIITTNNATGSIIAGVVKVDGTTNQTIKNNYIYGITTSDSTSQLFGFYITGGLSTISNNIISLGTTNSTAIFGIWEAVTVAGKNNSYYFNTIRIGGTSTSGTPLSIPFASNSTVNTRIIQNNIFVNARTNSGATGTNYAFYLSTTTTGTNLTIGYNDYFVSGTGGVLGFYGANVSSGTVIVTGKDVGSVNVDPVFANATGTAAVDFKASGATLTGVAGTGITTDYIGTTRNIPTMGAWESIAGLPTLAATTAATVITAISASSGGNVTAIGTSAVTTRGVCWSTTTGPTDALATKTVDGNGLGSFTSSITGLTANTTYFVRAYARNSTGAAYGAEISFTTLTNLPTLAATTAATSITATTASSGGNVTAIGASPVDFRGVCWSTTTGPTVALATKTVDGSGLGSFTSNITGLAASTTYFVRAYATNGSGTAYGAEISFTTLTNLPTLAATTAATSITATTASSGGNVTAIGASAVNFRGVCWSTTTGPTVALTTKTVDGSGLGSFTSSITGLAGNTTYFVRAYATNGSGTAYGAEISFTTLLPASPTPTILAANVKSIYSDTYTQAATYTSWDNWYNTPNTGAILADAGNARMFAVATGGVSGTSNFISPTSLDVSTMSFLHVDVYPTTATSVGVTLVKLSNGAASTYVSLGTLIPNQWNSKNIAISNYAGFSNDVKQVGFNSPSTGIFYMDNLYFYTVPAAPTGALTIVNSTCASACTVTGGSIALGTVAGPGGTLQYSTNGGGSWSAALPSYSGGLTILASVLDGNGNRSGNTTVGTTVAGVCTTPTAPTGALTIVNSTCASACTISGGSIAIGSVSGSGGTLEYSTNGGTTWSSTLPSYAAPQTIIASVINASGCRSGNTTVGATIAGTCTTPSVPTGSLTIVNSTCASACTVSGGSIAIGNVSANGGGTLEYSTNGGTNWSSTLPSYSAPQTIIASVINASGCRSGNTTVGSTIAGTCTTPSVPTGSLTIVNSTCASACTVSGGSIAIGNVSANGGGTLEYSTNGGTNWSSTLPSYSAPQTIIASVINGGGCRSGNTTIGATVAGTCTTPAAPTGSLTIVNSTCASACTVSGGSIAIGNVSANGGGTLEYSTDSGSNWSSTLPSYSAPQTIIASVINSGGCRSGNTTVGATIAGTCTTPATPTISAGSSTTFCSGGSVVLTSSSGTGYLWSTGATTASITVSTAGSYTVQVSNAGGCLSLASDPTTVAVTAQPEWFADVDNDGYSSSLAASIFSCTQPSGYKLASQLVNGGVGSLGTDCVDIPSDLTVNPLNVLPVNIHPGLTEVCYNNVDDNCNGTKSEGCAAVPVTVVNGSPASFSSFSCSFYSYPGATIVGYQIEIERFANGVSAGPAVTLPVQTSRFFSIPTNMRVYTTDTTLTTYKIRASAVINGEVVGYSYAPVTFGSYAIPKS
ncbi:MopE-related protein, partial [Flavobacterium paronense]